MPRVLLALLVIAMTAYAATDAWNAEDEDRRGLPRGLWLILILLLPGFGAIAWFALSSQTRRARAGASGRRRAPGARPGGGPGPAPRPGGPVAPDDDPEFLWRLEQERRRAARERRRDHGHGRAERHDKHERPGHEPEADDGATSADDGNPASP
ncbi:phospholipase D-like protein [Flavimobilis soli]|uniref:Phospholipase D-like protein n=1 Tax=Flavimobilis soli TaxID=442709 RepID=A0A2A9ED00_9MICO|nr:PLDc N-terminal domain-containing protein [Flavimobilis soli]PFG36506.1 phospholipase D-like protein [Flavimobilis soli]